MSDFKYKEIFLPIGISLTEADVIVWQWLHWHIDKWTDNATHPDTHPDDIKFLQKELTLYKKMLKTLHPELQEQGK